MEHPLDGGDGFADRLRAVEREVVRLRTDLEVQVRQMRNVRQNVRDALYWLDVHCSPPWKRFWWVVQGFRPYRLGRWIGSTGKGRFPYYDGY